jgi:hypothetical protein
LGFLDIVNYLKIGEVEHGARNQDLLNDLRDRATHIGRATGQEPASWYEFKIQNPQGEPKTMMNLLIGAAAGLAIGALAAIFAPTVLVPLAAMGAMIGGAVGAFTDTEHIRRDNLMKKYEHYLDVFEASASRGRAQGVEMGMGGKTTHVADLMAERQLAQNQVMLAGK